MILDTHRDRRRERGPLRPRPLDVLRERIDEVEKAVGAGGGPGQRGIAQRLDALEDRIAALEDAG